MLPLIIIFAKAPRPGFVKTRLGLNPTAAANLHTEFVRQTLRTALQLWDEAELELSTDTPCEDWTRFPVARTLQSEGDLGHRLYSALVRGLAAGHPKVTILGSDSPTLPADHLRELLRCDADVALGPALDGGFYAIACRKLNRHMLDRVRWSSSDALQDTVEAATRCGLTVSLGPPWFDVDTPEDLQLLNEGGGGMPPTRTDARGTHKRVLSRGTLRGRPDAAPQQR